MLVTTFESKKIGTQRIWKTIFFQDKFYSLKAHAHFFTVLIYLAISRAAKLCIFTPFTFTNLLRCSQSINSLIYVYSLQIPSCFLWVHDHSRDCFSSYCRRPRKFSVLPPVYFTWDKRLCHACGKAILQSKINQFDYPRSEDSL